jgi:hypothetical protein
MRVIHNWAIIVLGLLLTVWVLPNATASDECRKLRISLTKLREDYRLLGQKASADAAAVTFEDLTVVLDKIVEVRRAIRRLDCDSQIKKKRSPHGAQ